MNHNENARQEAIYAKVAKSRRKTLTHEDIERQTQEWLSRGNRLIPAEEIKDVPGRRVNAYERSYFE